MKTGLTKAYSINLQFKPIPNKCYLPNLGLHHPFLDDEDVCFTSKSKKINVLL